MITGLTYLKMNLNIESGYTGDDSLLTNYLTIAEQAVKNYCDDTFSGYTGYTDYPAPLYNAIILLASHFYLNRNMVSFGTGTEIPYSFKFILDPYKNYTIS